jgi:catechol 2,3-dioxygenase-like lactoylglutathione lyase family enzyme
VITGLDHVQLTGPPGCEDDARRFYGDLLGLTEIPKPPLTRATGGVWFQCGAQQLHIGIEEAFAPARKAHPGLLVAPDALDSLAARLLAAGVQPRWDERIPERRRFYAEDPWGNNIELTAPAGDTPATTPSSAAT